MFNNYFAIRNISHTELEEKHPYILTIKNNLAHLMMKMGKYADALKLFVFCLGGRSELLGAYHADTLATMNNLAELYGLIGEHDKARDLYEKGLRISYYLIDENDLFAVEIMNNLDKIPLNIIKYRNNLALFTNHLSLREAFLGTICVDTLHAMKDLQGLYKTILGHDESIVRSSHCFPLEESDGESAEVDNSLKRSLSFSDSEGSNPKDARKSSEEIIHENKEILCRSNLANNIVWLGLVEEILRRKDRDLLTMVNNVAFLYMKLGKYDRALPLFTNCLAMREEVLGKKHPDTLQSIRNLADLLKCMGRYYDALPLLHKYGSLLKKLVEPSHIHVTETNYDIALLYDKIGEYDKAQSMNDRSFSDEDSHRRKSATFHNPSLNNKYADVQDSYLAKLRYGFKYILSGSYGQAQHTSYVNAICSTRNYIVSASDDMRMLVWEVVTHRIFFKHELRGHTGPIVCLHVMRDKNSDILNQILSASHDGTIKHWDLNSGVCVQSIKHDDYGVNESIAVISSTYSKVLEIEIPVRRKELFTCLTENMVDFLMRLLGIQTMCDALQ